MKKRICCITIALCTVLCIVFAAGCGKTEKNDTALPEVRNNGTAIQWKYSDETDWRDLVLLTELTGAAGENGKNGTDGKDGADGINGKNGIDGKDGTDGKDGADGINGKDGANGKDGVNGENGTDGKNGTNGINGQNGSDGKDGKTPFIGENGNWWIGEIDTGIKAAGTDGKDGINGIDGTDGKQIEIQKTDLYIQWRYKGGEWQNLVALADILGPSGQNGTNGEDGRTPEFRVNGNRLQWRYAGDTIWLNLYDLSALKGADGKDGSCAGYFAANGSVYSAGKALPFTVKKKSGGLISYNASSNKITLSKGHTYSLVFSGTIAVSAKSDGKACGAALFDGYNSEMALETQTYVTAPKADQTEKLTMAYNTIYTAEEDITLTFQYTTMLLQDTNFKDARYNITIIALD